MAHLWEADHPYYMNEGSYCQAGCHTDFECLDDFLDNWSGSDIDMNRVHRWDWREGEDWGVSDDGSDDTIGRLSVYFIMQRKGYTYSCDITVRRSDEARVIDYLKPHADLNAKLWSDISTGAKETTT